MEKVTEDRKDKVTISYMKSSSRESFILYEPESMQWEKTKNSLKEIASSKSLTIPFLMKKLAEIALYMNKIKTLDAEQFVTLEKFLLHDSKERDKGGYIEIFPFIAEQALLVESHFPSGQIPLLQGNQTITIPRNVCQSLMANFFLGVFPEQKSKDLPDMQEALYFFRVNIPLMREKIKFYLNYFCAIKEQPAKGVLTITRPSFSHDPEHHISYLKSSPLLLLKADVIVKGKIEECQGASMIDFANKYLGGGCMKKGSVQEEILFLIYPELAIPRMLNVVMGQVDAIVISGIQQYSKYVGYADGTKYAGPFQDDLAEDIKKDTDFIKREIVAIDALKFRNEVEQLGQIEKNIINREIKKAWAGFKSSHLAGGTKYPLPIATGRWGCGAFKGNSQLKFLIQWIAASLCCRKMIFFSFGDENLKEANDVINKYSKSKISVLYFKLLDICFNYLKKNKSKPKVAASKEFQTFIFTSLLK